MLDDISYNMNNIYASIHAYVIVMSIILNYSTIYIIITLPQFNLHLNRKLQNKFLLIFLILLVLIYIFFDGE